MFRPWLIYMILTAALLAACGDGDDKGNDTSSATTAPPSPTSILSSRFNGPMLGNNDADEGDSSCSEGSDCGLASATDVEAALALALAPTTWQGLEIGVPDDFEALDFETRLSIETTDFERYEGSFRVSVRWTDAEGAQTLLASYANLDTAARQDHTTALGDGYIIPNADMGMVGVWTLPDERVVVIEGFVQPGYWPRYGATYMAIVDGITLNTR